MSLSTSAEASVGESFSEEPEEVSVVIINIPS